MSRVVISSARRFAGPSHRAAPNPRANTPVRAKAVDRGETARQAQSGAAIEFILKVMPWRQSREPEFRQTVASAEHGPTPAKRKQQARLSAIERPDLGLFSDRQHGQQGRRTCQNRADPERRRADRCDPRRPAHGRWWIAQFRGAAAGGSLGQRPALTCTVPKTTRQEWGSS